MLPVEVDDPVGEEAAGQGHQPTVELLDGVRDLELDGEDTTEEQEAPVTATSRLERYESDN